MFFQSAAGFSDMHSPGSAYEKTQPFEAGKNIFLKKNKTLIFAIFFFFSQDVKYLQTKTGI